MGKKKYLLIFLICAIIFFTFSVSAFACTTIIVGKDASADGSAYFGRTDDIIGTVGIQVRTIPAAQGAGDWEYIDKGSGFSCLLPVTSYQYFITPTFPSAGKGIKGEAGENEYGVCISATETLYANEDALKADPLVNPGIAETNIPTLILPYVKTAREGVERLGEFVEIYGSAESNGIIIGDKNEIWYMEIYTGHQWAAVKCPDDKFAIVANDAMIGYIDTDDTDNYLSSNNIYALAESNGFLKKVNGKPHLAATYNDKLRDYSQIRVWAGINAFAPKLAGEYDVKTRYELFNTPEHKISIDEIMELMRSRFEDTEYSVDIEGNNYRPIGIERTASSHIFQIKKGYPTISWVSLANPEFSVFIPLFGNLDSVPSEYKVDSPEYSEESAYWKFRSVSSLATLDRELYGKDVRDAYKALETKWISESSSMIEEYVSSGSTPQKASELFSRYSQQAFNTADSLLSTLLTKISVKVVNDSAIFGKDGDSEYTEDGEVEVVTTTKQIEKQNKGYNIKSYVFIGAALVICLFTVIAISGKKGKEENI